MMKQARMLALVALSTGACAVEHRTVVVADDPCTSCGYTTSSADYSPLPATCCRSAPLRYGRAPVGYREAQIVADSQTACLSYGLIPSGLIPSGLIKATHESGDGSRAVAAHAFFGRDLEEAGVW